jgi:hypothetical protein
MGKKNGWNGQWVEIGWQRIECVYFISLPPASNSSSFSSQFSTNAHKFSLNIINKERKPKIENKDDDICLILLCVQ